MLVQPCRESAGEAKARSARARSTIWLMSLAATSTTACGGAAGAATAARTRRCWVNCERREDLRRTGRVGCDDGHLDPRGGVSCQQLRRARSVPATAIIRGIIYLSDHRSVLVAATLPL